MAGRGRISAHIYYNNHETMYYFNYNSKDELRANAKKDGLKWKSKKMTILFEDTGSREHYERHGTRWYKA